MVKKTRGIEQGNRKISNGSIEAGLDIAVDKELRVKMHGRIKFFPSPIS